MLSFDISTPACWPKSGVVEPQPFRWTRRRKKRWEEQEKCGPNLRTQGETHLPVDTHDFPDEAKGKAVPYGVYDIHRNEAGSVRRNQF